MDDVGQLFRGIMTLVAVAAFAEGVAAGPIREGFDAGALPAAASDPAVRFFGHTFDSLRVNARGNVSFAAPLPDFAPVPLGRLRDANISPFFAVSDAVTPASGGGGLASAVAGEGAAYAGGSAPYGRDAQAIAAGGPRRGNDSDGPDGSSGKAGAGGAGGGRAMSAGYGWAALRSMFPVVGDPDDSSGETALAEELLSADGTGLDLALDDPRPGVGTDGTDATTGPGAAGGAPAGVVGTPEPGTLVLGLIGAAGLLTVRRRKTAV